MSDLAKQEAIGFNEFIKDNSYTKSEGKGWYRYYIQRTDFPSGCVMSTPVYDFITIEELWELYQKSKEGA